MGTPKRGFTSQAGQHEISLSSSDKGAYCVHRCESLGPRSAVDRAPDVSSGLPRTAVPRVLSQPLELGLSQG